jgi:preflagellin peptidase FlaK
VEPALAVDWAAVLLAHFVASIQDVRTREISDWIWVLGGAVSVPIGIYVSVVSGELLNYVVSSTVGVVLALAIYFMRLMGGADSKSLILTSLSIPTVDLGTPALTIINITPLSVLVNSLIISLIAYIPYNLMVNLRNRGCTGGGILHLILLTCVPAHQVLRNPNNYSIAQVPSEGGFRPVLGLRLSLEDPRDTIIKWISEGRIRVDTYIFTTYHIPYIVPITLALILYLVTGRNLITYIIPT